MKTVRRVLFALAVGVCLSSVLVWLNDTTLHIPAGIIGIVAVSAAALAAFVGVAEIRSWRLPDPEEPPVSRVATPRSPVEKAIQAMDDAHEVSTRTERKVRIRIDTEDARSD